MVSILKKHLLLGLVILLALSGSALFLAYTNWNEQNLSNRRKSDQQILFAKLDKDVKASVQRKIEAAKKAEAEAKAKAEADAKAVALIPKPTVSLATTTPANCDITEPTRLTVVINKKHCFKPIDWAPTDLTSVDGFLLRDVAGLQLSAMMTSAVASGVGFSLSSAYRSYANQVITYNNWVAVNGSVAAADTVSARPGFSEHQTGLAVDLKAGGCTLNCFGTTAQYAWLREHAASYGYIERYPAGLTSITGYSAESWHWRYVGAEIAQDMKTKGIQTLEQYLGVSGGDY